MMIRFKKARTTLNVLLVFCLTAWTIASLTGCGASKNIPPASILSSGRITLSWDEVPGAASYNVYLATSPGVTTLNSYKIPDVSNPITITDLEPGTTYYFVVTVENDSGASRKSKEVSYTVTDTQGVIEFGDILSQSKPEEKSIASEEVSVASAPVTKSTAKPDSEQRPVESTKSAAEVIICFGDSLTFGTGAGKGMDYPSQLAGMLHKPVINQGIPGDTTASALSRLFRDVLSKNPDIVLITLGGNDLKNGVSKEFAFDNLKMIVESIQKRGAKVIIGGLKISDMDRGFGYGYEQLAKQTGATLIPNIYEDIMGNRQLMSDPIHPNDAGYKIIAQRFYNAITSSEPKTAVQPEPKRRQAEATGSNVPAKETRPVPKAGDAETRDVTLAWDDVPSATSYNIYWSDTPGVTKKNGTKISNVKNPCKMKGLRKGKKYYFVVTAVNASGESQESDEFSFTVGQ